MPADARVHRHELMQGQIQDKLVPTGVFVAGYLLVWLGSSIVAASLHWLLEREAFVSTTMSSVIAAGFLGHRPESPRLCISSRRSEAPACRIAGAPTAFLSSHWRPHALGALRLAVLHGVICVGCCRDADGAVVRWWGDEFGVDRRACRSGAGRKGVSCRPMGWSRRRNCLDRLGQRDAFHLIVALDHFIASAAGGDISIHSTLVSRQNYRLLSYLATCRPSSRRSAELYMQ